MTQDEIDFLFSEITTLKRLLVMTPEKNVIDRGSLIARMMKVREELAKMGISETESENLRKENLEVKEQLFQSELQEVLSNSRTFEFRRRDTDVKIEESNPT